MFPFEPGQYGSAAAVGPGSVEPALGSLEARERSDRAEACPTTTPGSLEARERSDRAEACPTRPRAPRFGGIRHTALLVSVRSMPSGRHSLPLDDSTAAGSEQWPEQSPEEPLDESPPPPAGWYADAADARQWRHWSGTSWTGRVHPRGAGQVARYLPVGESNPAGESAEGESAAGESAAGESTAAARDTVENAGLSASVPLVPGDLRSRIAGQSVMEEALRLHDAGRHHETASWQVGAVGERHVGRILESLGAGWTVLHSVPVGDDDTDIDHVLIGPPGVFTLNTKHRPGKSVWVAGRAIRVNGRPEHYLNNAAREVERAERALSAASGLAVEVVGLIVVVGAALTIRARPETDGPIVRVLSDADLLGALHSRRSYSDEQLARIVAAAVRPETWSARRLQSIDAPALLLRFEMLGVARRPAAAFPQPKRVKAPPAPRRTPPEERGLRAVPPRKPSIRRRKKQSALSPLLGGVAALIIIWGVTTSNRTDAEAPASPSAQQEQAALMTAANAAAAAIDANSPEGVRPTALTVTPGQSLLQTDTGVTLADLPDGTTASYAITGDRSYSLTLTGPDYGSVVTVTPEAGATASQ